MPPAKAPLRSGSPKIVEDAEVTEPPITLSAEDPAILAITRITGPTGVLLPPASETEQRAVVLAEMPKEVEADDAIATSSFNPVVLTEVSSSPVAVTDNFSVETQEERPGSDVPHSTPTQAEPTGGDHDQNRERAREKPSPLSGKALRAQLRSLDSSVERLQKLRREVQEDVLEAHKQEIAKKEEELNLLHRRVSYLEKQLKKAEQVNGNGAHPTTVGHLQRISSTRAYILFPNVGQTAVYSLTSADLDILDLRSWSESLSCEPL